MAIVFDPEKDAINIVKHGVSLARAIDMQIVAFEEDRRFEYGEVRYRAYGLLDNRPHCLVFHFRDGQTRAISFRPAHMKEYKRHVR